MTARRVRLPRPRWTATGLAAFLGVLGLLPGTAAAQEGLTTGSIAGRVVDADGAPVPNAVVTATSVERGTRHEALTDEQGRYVVPLLSPGQYMVGASSPPLPEVERGPIEVSLGERTSLELTLEPIEVEAIAVTVAPGEAEITQGGVIELVNEAQIDALPTAGRDFTDFINLSGLVSLQPEVGTGGQFSIGGARSSGTNITIDGADANNAFFGENRGSSRIPFTFSLESIKEFQIITNGYDVEYANYTGGLINAVTRAGTNEFEGSAFLYWRDEALTAEGFDGTEPADFSSYQFGGTLSGPIIRDRLHFFASADIQQRDQPTFALDPVASGIPQQDIAQFRTILENEYGIETEGQFGVFEETDDEVNLFGRLDWTIDPDNRLTFRANWADFENVNDRISPGGNEARTVGGTFHDEALSLVAELNSVFGANVYNTFRAQYSAEDRPRPGNSRLPSAEVEVGDNTLTYGGAFFGILFANNLEEDKIQITDNLTIQSDDHTFKIGTDNIFSHTENLFWLNGNGFFTFDSLEDFANRDPSFFLRFVPQTPPGQPVEPPFAEFDIQEYSIYAQDAWQVTPRLLLTAGVRYGITNFADEGAPLNDPEFRSILADTFRLSTTTVPDDNDNISPRLAFTYDANGDETSVFRGGVGIFYGRIPGVLHGNVLSKTPRPLIAVGCFGDGIPEFNYGQWVDGVGIPTGCASDAGFADPPVVTVWDADTELPTTLKANLGYSRILGEDWRAGINLVFSRTTNNFHVADANLRPGLFQTAEGRPVHVAEGDFDPTDAASSFDRARNTTFDRIFLEGSGAEARSWNLQLEASGRPTEDLRVGANYTLNVAHDNSSFSCCTEDEGMFGTPTFGNPNFIGDIGDDERGAWGPSAFERRHVFVANAIWSLPAGFEASVIYRAQSGNPFTPIVSGDINADGTDDNDRPFIPDPDNPTGLLFETAEDAADFREILDADGNECLREAVGSVIGRNTCRNPWWHSLNLKFTKGFETFSGQRAEIVLDMFNVLDGLGMSAGEFVFKENDLLRAEGYDPATNRVIYSVNGIVRDESGDQVDGFGREIPVGFEPFQFQVQLGVRYSF